jgi:hypothetical protein
MDGVGAAGLPVVKKQHPRASAQGCWCFYFLSFDTRRRLPKMEAPFSSFGAAKIPIANEIL